MNSRLVSEFSARFRAFCSQIPKRSTNRADYLTPQQILDDPAIQSLLQKSNLAPSSPINDPQVKLSILSYLSQACNVPVASNAFLNLSTADRIANWYSTQLKPCRARPHARNLIRHTLAEGEESKEVDDRIDLERETVQEELEAKIPSNVVLDERTFLKVEEKWVRKRVLPKPQIGRQ